MGSSLTQALLLGMPLMSGLTQYLGAQYRTLQMKIWWRKINICRFNWGNWFFSCMFALLRLVKKRSKAMHMLEKRVINMIWLLLPLIINDWSRWFAISSSHVYAVAVPVSWVGLKRRKYVFRVTYWEQHRWGCSLA